MAEDGTYFRRFSSSERKAALDAHNRRRAAYGVDLLEYDTNLETLPTGPLEHANVCPGIPIVCFVNTYSSIYPAEKRILLQKITKPTHHGLYNTQKISSGQ